ncbi:MAG: ribosome silencing factor [Bacteroidales bacterium]|nr:ribosome silencing factor [Bacteroidales bacterium]MBN2748824.1 ribosome silencing factor [Bacteroidales bacterium]
MIKKQQKTSVEQLLESIVNAIQDKKGSNIVSIEIGKLPNAVCEYFVICHANSTTQVGAIADNIEDELIEKHHEKIWQKAGQDNAIWIILDYVDIVVHVFQKEWRDFYRLEELWADAQIKKYEDVNA